MPIYDADQYQLDAARTLISKPPRTYSDQELMVIWNILGAVGELGELANHLKKGIFHDHGIDETYCTKEIGDASWYLAALCTGMHQSFAATLRENIEKLKKRYPEGFSTEASVNRVE